MKTLKKQKTFWYLLAPFVLVLIVLACEQEADPEAQDFTGEEMFRGVFFQQGEVADILGTVNENLTDLESSGQDDQELSVKYLEFTNEIVNQIDLLDPEYFNDFKNQIVSDNYYAIELSMVSGSNMIQAAGLKSDTYSELFQLLIELQDRNITVEELLGDYNLSNSQDAENFRDFVKETYGFDLNEDSFRLVTIAYYWPCNSGDYGCITYWKEKFKSVLFNSTDDISYASDDLVVRLAELF